MKTNRELLELAAKAAGIKIDKSEFNGGGRGNTGFDILGNAVIDWHNNKKWNPLTDDGDALRLAVRLRLTVRVWVNAVVIEDCAGNRLAYEDTGCRAPAYELEATRRAIVRAAAAIGERMN